MPAEEPRWWYDAPDALPARMLAPAAGIYGMLASRRMRRSDGYRSRLRVICIGNFTAGGTGKTPTAQLVARLLRENGDKPVFLSRGYGGGIRGPHRVDADNDRAAAVGDEPLLLAATAPAFIARDRANGARLIETEIAAGRLDATVIVMDDGLQNPSLAKDVTIAVVDARRGIGNGRVIPAGPLRAPLDAQLAAVDAIIVNGEGETTAIARLFAEFAGPVLRARTRPREDASWLNGQNVVAFAGIGNPHRFFALLERQGASIVRRFVFPDHAQLGADDARNILATARQLNAILVTTEKDSKRLFRDQGPLAELERAAKTLAIELVLETADLDRLRTIVARGTAPD